MKQYFPPNITLKIIPYMNWKINSCYLLVDVNSNYVHVTQYNNGTIECTTTRNTKYYLYCYTTYINYDVLITIPMPAERVKIHDVI